MTAPPEAEVSLVEVAEEVSSSVVAASVSLASTELRVRDADETPEAKAEREEEIDEEVSPPPEPNPKEEQTPSKSRKQKRSGERSGTGEGAEEGNKHTRGSFAAIGAEACAARGHGLNGPRTASAESNILVGHVVFGAGLLASVHQQAFDDNNNKAREPEVSLESASSP